MKIKQITNKEELSWFKNLSTEEKEKILLNEPYLHKAVHRAYMKFKKKGGKK